VDFTYRKLCLFALLLQHHRDVLALVSARHSNAHFVAVSDVRTSMLLELLGINTTYIN
jgi:hypothetical protein